MSSLPTPEELAGPYYTQYEVYYRRLDPDQKNEIGAMEAATFLKKSGLSDDILGKIWDISDADGKGTLDKTGFFAACKLVALVQDHHDCLACNLKNECPAPNFGDATAPGAPTAKAPVKAAPSINFLVKPEEKRKYDALFDQLQPVDGKLPGDKVRQVMMGSKLPMPILGKIWDLSDIDRDGFLDRYEFTISMHLVYRNLQGDPIPAELPAELSKSKIPGSLSATPNLNGGPPKPAAAQTVEAVPWVINAGERLRYNALFRQTDSDKDGYVSGVEIKNIFLQTGLPQNILAHIWNLCDIKQEGKLNPEQFALAMWLIQRKQAGKDPPAGLTPDMVPPSLRPKGQDAGVGSVYNNPELEMIAKEIQSMLSEKLQIEKEVQEVEYQISVKNTECHSLQSEFDTLSATHKQLSNQRDVAQKRLDALDEQKNELLEESKKMDSKIQEQLDETKKLQTQADEQEETLLKQEEEVHGKRREYEKLKEEEKELTADLKKTQKEIERLEEDIKLATELDDETKEKLEILQEAEAHMTKANTQFDNANEECSNVTDNYLEPLRLNLELPDYSRLEKPRKPPVPEAPVMSNSVNGTSDGGFNAFGTNGGQTAEWASNDAFGSSYEQKSGVKNIHDFASFDPFGIAPSINKNTRHHQQSTNQFPPSKLNQFDAFGFPKISKFNSGISPNFGNDSGDDHPPPLAPRPDSGAGEGGLESPTPALPPKNTAPPPKRPPPPRRPPPPGGGGGGGQRAGPAPPVPPPPKSGGSSPDDDDPFSGNKNDAGGGFADFAKFDTSTKNTNKITNMDSAFASPNHDFRSPPTIGGGYASSDSAFSSSDQTPTHTSRAGGGMQNSTQLEFSEDPFQNANHRYGDPFELAGADPFGNQADPFTAPVSDAFGATQEAHHQDNSKQNESNNHLASLGESAGDPFSLTLRNALKEPTKDPFASSSSHDDPFASAFDAQKTRSQSTDPFGSSFANDPFAPSAGTASRTQDDWFTSSPFGAAPKVDGISKTNKSASKNTSKSLAVGWGDGHDPFGKSVVTKVNNADPFGSAFVSKNKNLSKVSQQSGGSDLLTGSPLKGAAEPVKEKKKHKWVPKLPSTGKGDKMTRPFKKSQPDLTATQQAAGKNIDQMQLKMVAEASRKTEEERLKRLKLQEEQDLAYAIALSKAEAASLKTS